MTGPDGFTPDRGRRRWPLLAIGASAGTATWSGWVGLGQLTGFGVVHPLPGIADGFTINTAVTLPIGVEAYAMYALSIATSAQQLPARTRRYAWASSAAALLLGMAGQVAYHVMTARHPVASGHATQLAPWQVIALVSCLPVLVLGAASLLWHLAGTASAIDHSTPAARDTPATPAAGAPESTGAPRVLSQEQEPTADGLRPALPEDLARLRDAIAAAPGHGPLPGSDPVASVSGSDPVPHLFPVTATGRPSPGNSGDTDPAESVASGKPDRSAQRRSARWADVAALRAAIVSGALPPDATVRQVREHLGISSGHAAAARRSVAAEPARASHEPTATDGPPAGHPELPFAPPPAERPAPAPEHRQEQAAPDQEESPEQQDQEHISAVTKKTTEEAAGVTETEGRTKHGQKEPEDQTYAVVLT